MGTFATALASVGLGLFGAHHSNAVAKEQTGTAAANQQIESAFADIKNAFLSGMISASDAKSRIDSAVNDYGSQTASIRTGGQSFFGRGWTVVATGARQGVKGQCNAACVYWSAYNDIGQKLKASFDGANVPTADNSSQYAQSGIRQASSLSAAPGLSGRASFAANVPATPGSASLGIAGIDFSDPKVLAGLAIGAVLLVVLLTRPGGK